jgi:hypothetical protein
MSPLKLPKNVIALPKTNKKKTMTLFHFFDKIFFLKKKSKTEKGEKRERK